MGEESVTSIHLYDEFYVNLLFDRSIYRPMRTHMGHGRWLGVNRHNPQTPENIRGRFRPSEQQIV